MAHSSPPAPYRPDDPAGDAQNTPRSPLRRLLRRIIMLVVTLAILIGIIALVHANNSTSAPVRSVSSSTGAQTTSASKTSRASSAPDFTLHTLAGTTFHLAAKLGRVVVLYFMATGCAGCEPGSYDLAHTLLSSKIRGAEALAIDLNTGDQPADLQAFVQSAGIPASAPVQWGIDTTGAIVSSYHVQALETTVVIDTRGQVAYRSDGSIPPEQLAQIVRNLA